MMSFEDVTLYAQAVQYGLPFCSLWLPPTGCFSRDQDFYLYLLLLFPFTQNSSLLMLLKTIKLLSFR